MGISRGMRLRSVRAAAARAWGRPRSAGRPHFATRTSSGLARATRARSWGVKAPGRFWTTYHAGATPACSAVATSRKPGRSLPDLRQVAEARGDDGEEDRLAGRGRAVEPVEGVVGEGVPVVRRLHPEPRRARQSADERAVIRERDRHHQRDARRPLDQGRDDQRLAPSPEPLDDPRRPQPGADRQAAEGRQELPLGVVPRRVRQGAEDQQRGPVDDDQRPDRPAPRLADRPAGTERSPGRETRPA